jgi:hypothetical protein
MIGSSGRDTVKAVPGCPACCSVTASRTSCTASSARVSGSGMRANLENSSTIRRRSLVWRTTTSVICASDAASSSDSCLPNLRLMRSAESWIGVSGFLISCAMRRATSPQAAMRCAETRSVTSSKATT